MNDRTPPYQWKSLEETNRFASSPFILHPLFRNCPHLYPFSRPYYTIILAIAVISLAKLLPPPPSPCLCATAAKGFALLSSSYKFEFEIWSSYEVRVLVQDRNFSTLHLQLYTPTYSGRWQVQSKLNLPLSKIIHRFHDIAAWHLPTMRLKMSLLYHIRRPMPQQFGLL